MKRKLQIVTALVGALLLIPTITPMASAEQKIPSIAGTTWEDRGGYRFVFEKGGSLRCNIAASGWINHGGSWTQVGNVVTFNDRTTCTESGFEHLFMETDYRGTIDGNRLVGTYVNRTRSNPGGGPQNQFVLTPVSKWPPTYGSQVIGVAGVVKGEVWVTDPSTGERVPVNTSTPIRQNAKIETGPTGKFQLMLKDETVFTIGPDSECVMDEFVYDPSTDIGKITAKLTKGVFRFVTGKIARKKPSSSNIKLPSGAIGIRGTDFVVQLIDDKCIVTVVEGVIEYRPYLAATGLPARSYPHAFKIPGTVVSVARDNQGRELEIGAKVHSGDVLAVLDQRDLRAAEQEARARKDRAVATLHHAQSSIKNDPQSISDARLKQLEAEASLAAAQWDLAKEQIANATLRARVDGFITKRQLQVGQYVRSNQVVFEVSPSPVLTFSKGEQVVIGPNPMQIERRTADQDAIKDALELISLANSSIR